jgi:hypothetical protein
LDRQLADESLVQQPRQFPDGGVGPRRRLTIDGEDVRVHAADDAPVAGEASRG